MTHREIGFILFGMILGFIIGALAALSDTKRINRRENAIANGYAEYNSITGELELTEKGLEKDTKI